MLIPVRSGYVRLFQFRSGYISLGQVRSGCQVTLGDVKSG
jgi:hypothetical protein